MKTWKRIRRSLGIETPVHFAQYGGVRFFESLVRAMSLPRAMAAGAALGDAFRLVDGRHRAFAEGQAKTALGVDDARAADIVRGVYRHFGRVVVDLLVASRWIDRRNWREFVRIDGLEHLDRAARAAGSALLVGGHLGNWEIAGFALALGGYPLRSVARRQDNPFLDAHLNRFRTATGQGIIPRQGALREMVRSLREGKVVAVLADQDARGEGVFVPFFGRPASTVSAPAALSVRLGTALLPFTTRRVGDGFRFHVVIEEPVRARPGADRGGEILRLTAHCAARLEAGIRECPEQWLWMHRRWKTRPAEGADSASRLRPPTADAR